MLMRMNVALLSATMVASSTAAQNAVAGAGAPTWGERARLVQELKIGQLEGAEQYAFGSIDGIAVGLDGAIFVFDEKVPVIRMYDAAGKFVRNVGRKGAGPGEYDQVLGIKTMADGRIAVWDAHLNRITLYDGKGEYRTSLRVQSGFFSDDVFAVDRAGNFYVKAARFSATDHSLRNLIWVKVSPTGQVLDSIPVPPEHEGGFVIFTSEGTDYPFVRSVRSTFSPLGYIVTGSNATYSFTLMRPGQPLKIERHFQPVPVALAEKAEWDAWADRFASRPSGVTVQRPGADGKPRIIEHKSDRTDVPTTKPAYRELYADEEGRIWVDRYVTATQRPDTRKAGSPMPPHVWREPRTFDVFDPSGRFLGTVVAPPNTLFEVRRGMQLWGVTRGEFDEQYVVRYRIEPVAR